MEHIELKGFRSHWRWTGLTYYMCVACKWMGDRNPPPEICPGCKSIMIQPEPVRGGRQ